MDYDSYIQELISDSVPLSRAEYAVAEAVCEHMNELADNAYHLYEQALQQRCQEQEQLYVNNRQAPAKFPLELFTSNIKTNKLDATKWNATIQDYLLKHMPLANSSPHADKEKEILNRLSAVDRMIDASFPLKKDLPPDAAPFVVAIPISIYIGAAIAGAVIGGIGVGVGILHNKRKNKRKKPAETHHGGGPIHVPGTDSGPERTTAPSRGDPPPPLPPLIPGTTQGQVGKRDDRDKRKKRKTDKDQRRKARKDYYFGYVDRVEPAGSGSEIRVDAIAENSLSDEVFIREIQKLTVAAGSPCFGRYRLALISIFVRNVPPAVEVGKWINFKVDIKTKTPATPDSPDVSGAFADGVTLLETLESRLSFPNFRTECYFAENDGYVVQTDVKTITNDITASNFDLLQTVFGAFDLVAGAIGDLLAQFMNPNSTHETADGGAIQRDTLRVAQASITLPKTKKPQPRKFVNQDEASVENIKAAIFPQGTSATKYNLYDVGQGHSGRVFSGQTEMFASDFGYGRLENFRKVKVSSHMIRGQGHLPILLSHWDADHFRIAKSFVAGTRSGTADDVTRRVWVAPGGSHIKGPTTHELAWMIKQKGNLLQWPEETTLKVGNVTIVSCLHNKQYKLPDKNNFGALALVIGSGDDLLIYPGDANFESIPNMIDCSGKVRTLIATHHGSTVALNKSKGNLGASIPKASSGNSYTLFSYAKGNTYGHNVRNAFPAYEEAGYGLFDATETFYNTGQDTFEIAHFEHERRASDNSLMATRIQATEPLQQTPAASVRGTRPGIEATSMPQPPVDSTQVTVVPSEGTSKQFPGALTLTGSGNATHKPGQDDLLPYAVTDEFGDIVIYDIIATKIILEKLPLTIPCNTDYPVTVQISCHDIEIRDTEPQVGLIPLVCFDVASGLDWAQEADPGQDGQPGNPGYAGGRVRLAVAGDWSRTGVGAKTPMSGLSLQYRGGSGSSGQKGGAGVPGHSGKDGGVIAADPKGKISYGGPTPENGTDGGNGGRGGDAGAPGTIANSEVLTIGREWPAGLKVVIDPGSPGTDSEYGNTGSAGKGGAGAPGGKGSKYTATRARPTGEITSADMQHRSKNDGKDGRIGDNGKEFDRSMAQFRTAKVNLRTIATENEMLDQMAPVDWRFYSE